MKRENSKSGFVLVVAMIATLVVGIVTVGLIGITLQEHRLSIRSSAYSRALQAAESGVNLACEALVNNNGWSTGWSSSGALTNSFGTVVSSYSASGAPSGTDSYVITSTGRVVLAGSTIQRTVQVTVKHTVSDPRPYFKYGLLSKAALHMSGSVAADSFDSTDIAKSTNGQYDPAKAGKNATVATLSTDTPAIKVDGGAILSGISELSVGEGGTIDIAHWISFTGTKSYNATQDIADVTIPFSPAPSGDINVGPWPNQAQTIVVNGAQDMSVEDFKVTASGALTITGSGTLRIYVDGKTTVSGSGKIQISPSPSTADLKVEIYVNDKVNIAGSGVLNNTYRAANCAILGTTNCTDVSITGNSGYIGTVYAPQADVDLTGSSIAMGAFLGGSVKFSGNTRYYIDESLIGEPTGGSSDSTKPYKLTGWTEL